MSDDATVFTPRLNHVAISVDPALMDDRGRAELLDFYGDVFGWTEGDNTGESGNPLILYTGTFAQFVYLLPGDPFLVAPRLDHFGLQVATIAELEAIVGRAKARATTDDRVTVIDPSSRDHTGSDARLQVDERVHRVRAAAHDRVAAHRAPGAALAEWRERTSRAQ